ncbi:MAG: efflux RND transporter periplasmic adaptor subunit [Chitinophagaceae bacterium]|nr:MAG: efflux RND transporter periplasmic adaptor subunit [Chitinophagaceae bacterium]
MNKKLKWLLISLAAIAILWIAFAMFGKKDKGEKVAVETVTKRTIIETVTASGNIYPEVEVKISPDISGEITELNVQEGDSVKKGQVLARIFADIYALQRDEAASQVGQSQASVANSTAALEATRAAMDQAKLGYDRNKALYDQKVISQAEFEQFETTYRSAQANFNAAQQSIRGLKASVQAAQTGLTRANKDLGRTTLVAPMNGVISSLQVKKGERVAGNSFNIGTEMMTVADMSVMEVRVDVGENDIVKINIGDSADVELDAYNNRKFKGIVTQIASSIKSGTAAAAVSNEVTNYEVRIRLDYNSYKDLIDPAKPKRFPFRPGMNANADIKTKRKDNVMAAPITAVNARVKGSDKSMEDRKKEAAVGKDNQTESMQEESGISDELEEVVFVLLPDNTVKKVVVSSGIQDINYIEIRNGLKGGEKVVVGPYNAISKTLKDGMKVIVVPKEKLFEKK